MTPARRALLLAAMWVAVAALASAGLVAPVLFAGAGLGLAALALLDLGLVARSPPLLVERDIAASLALGVSAPVVLRFHNQGRRARRLIAHDQLPNSFQTDDLPHALRVPAGGYAELRYRVRPRRRGTFALERADFLVRSPLGLWWRRRRPLLEQEVRVYPNFRAVARYALLATDNRTSQLGIRHRQRRGQGLEFHQLREYRVGDALRQIDWRATSRLHKVISREYRDERDQQIVFLLDCGRRMHGDDEEATFLDHALDAVLLLAYVALRQGDAVGLMTFGGAERWLLPRKGQSNLNRLLNATYDLDTSPVASDVYEAIERALQRLRKRSLLVLVSNLRDEEDEELVEALRLAQRRHLVLLASLREHSLGAALEQLPLSFAQARRLAATRAYLRARYDAHQQLRNAGVLFLDVEPRALSHTLVNKYLEVKAAGVL